MQRRAFLSIVAGATYPASPAARIPIIDAHTHFYDPARPLGVPWPSKDNHVLYRTMLPSRFRKIVEPLGVCGTVVIEASPWPEDNRWLLDLAKNEPFIVGVVGNLEPGTPEFRGRLERLARNHLFRGIRTSSALITRRLDEPRFLEDLRALASVDLELDVAGGPEMFPLLAVISDRVPDLRMVINHLPFDQPGTAVLRELHDRPRIYAKVSGLLRRWNGSVRTDAAFFRPKLDELWEVFGTDRVVYGSNWPVSDQYGTYTEAFHIVAGYFAAKGPTAARKYFRDNSRAAYKWTDRAKR